MKISGKTQIMSFSATEACKTTAAHMTANSMGISVKISCIAVFAFSTVLASTGIDCGIHMFFPSRETEGVAISFMTESSISAAQSSSAARFVLSPKAVVSIVRISAPLISRKTPRTGRSSTPSPQLSI